MEYDFLIIGAGPAGLSAAIHLKQLAAKENREISVCVLEKGSAVGAHTLSGAVLEPRTLKELLPDTWKQAPLYSEVQQDSFYYLTKTKSFKLPTPKPMANDGNYIISLGELVKFLAKQAEDLGCEIYAGFSAADIIFDEDSAVIGVVTGEMGVDKNNVKSPNYQPGMHIHAKQTLFSEGCRGQLSQKIIHKFDLKQNSCPQTYALGLKEIWEIPKEMHEPGNVTHTVGWPLDSATYGGSFIYHLPNNKIALGFVIGLDYKNPWLNTFSEFQRFKTHPLVSKLLANGTRISYGARALNEGGLQSIPKLSFPGGVLIGDSAGFLNVAKIKGIHTAMHSGMVAAKTSFDLIKTDLSVNVEYEIAMQKSWVFDELYKVRNIRPGFRFGLIAGLVNAGFETYISKGKSPWTLKNHADFKQTKKSNKANKITYPKPDGILTFDILSSVYLSNTFHEENQPCHLKLRDKSLAMTINYKEYSSPETRYCPAGVYEIVDGDNGPKLQINAQNCLHCKTCDIKDPKQNIVWTAPEGGGGPNYIEM
ncbi:MAG: electron transfer flavoprotein-ubiquinone oxidoreductase [Legionellaceae bacterium]|nr:electron transfer flavoprotein-ubiquinone oxidoreductase [Legionellaceae bacterium]